MAFLGEGLLEIYKNQVQHRTAADAIYWTLRDAIRKGMIAPGSRLIEEEIASELEISRTPVREAFRRLQSEQLLEKATKRGLVVPILTLDDLIEIFEIEELIFGLIARKAAQYMSETELELLKECVTKEEKALDAGNLEEASDAAADFHALIAHGSKNERLRMIYSQFDPSPRLQLFEFAPDRVGNALAEHWDLYRAIAAHDVDQAEKIAEEHSRNAMRAQIKAQKIILKTT